MTLIRLVIFSSWLISSFSVFANESSSKDITENSTKVQIIEPFIELHTGPHEAYPVTQIIERGQWISVLKQKTRWYKIAHENGLQGWVKRDQLTKTLKLDGELLQFSQISQDDFNQRHFELGVLSGQFEGAPVFSVYTAYAFNKKLSVEFNLGQSIGNVSSTNIYKFNVLMHPLTNVSYIPFFALGIGQIEVKPSATLIDPIDKQNAMAQIGLGIKKHLSERFIVRAEWNDYVIFSASNEEDSNEGIEEWKVGFALFF